MLGAICKLDVLSHPAVTIRCFGWKVFLRALAAGRSETFLSMVGAGDPFARPAGKAFEIVGRCADLELLAKQIYQSAAKRFAQFGRIKRFLETLAGQEQEHAELLDLCRIAASRGRWDGDQFDPWREAVPLLERQMRQAQSSLESVASVVDALRLVLEIESSEINDLFSGVVAASDSDFVRGMRAFRDAARTHIAYICQQIPVLEPSLAQESQALREQYPSVTA